jgi:hypothetical protein
MLLVRQRLLFAAAQAREKAAAPIAFDARIAAFNLQGVLSTDRT